MANTYDWHINQLDAKIKQDGKDNVIYTVHWTYTAKDKSKPEDYMASSIGTHNVEYVEGQDFIEYADLKKSDVVAWLEAGIDVDLMKSNLDYQIELQKNPVDEYLHPDWE
ncbi:MAG: hypothetical protein Tp139SUR460282_3 [Prokaryotic dsDNA virus sp.]|jgi:tetrahydromethanopterin S-methyltransferase subunit H|nr:MAG: hypothetical protein Tp139SUR460282_3 [Prokaryotic dsDNA virus sp.]|tara:strand:+ start:1719 stop:2048 length:330 start_codon:yes stop_codon:yes gene_type:complete